MTMTTANKNALRDGGNRPEGKSTNPTQFNEQGADMSSMTDSQTQAKGNTCPAWCQSKDRQFHDEDTVHDGPSWLVHGKNGGKVEVGTGTDDTGAFVVGVDAITPAELTRDQVSRLQTALIEAVQWIERASAPAYAPIPEPTMPVSVKATEQPNAPTWADEDTKAQRFRSSKLDTGGTLYTRTTETWEAAAVTTVYRDELRVEVSTFVDDEGEEDPSEVWVGFTDTPGLTVTPADARKVAAALVRAADLAEGGAR